MSAPVRTPARIPARISGRTSVPDVAPARAIGALTRMVAARARQAHSGRAFCGASAAVCVVLGCVVERGGSIEDPDALFLALLVGGLAFFAWRLSRSVAPGEIARLVDGKLGFGGAFVAAYETERDRPHSAVAQLGAARLLARVRRRDTLEAAIPHTVGFVALPLLGIAGLLFAIDAQDARTRDAGFGTLSALTLSATIGQIADQPGDALDGAQIDQLAQVAQQAAGAASQSGQEQRRTLAEVAEELDALAGEAPPGSEVAEALSRAAAQAEAAALDVDGHDAPRAADTTEDRGPGPAAWPAEGASEGAGEGAGEGAAEGAGEGAAEGPAEGAAKGAAEGAADGTAGGDGAAAEGAPGDGPGGSGPERTEPVDGAGAGGGAHVESDGASGSESPASVSVVDPLENQPDAAAAPGRIEPAPTVGAPAPAGPTGTVGQIRWWSDRDASIVRRWSENAQRRARF